MKTTNKQNVKKFAINSVSKSRKPTYYQFKDTRSLTTPEYGLTVRTIMAKFAQGISVPTYSGIYSEDLPDLRHMDIHEIEQWKKDNKAHLEDLEQRKKNAITDYNTAMRDRKIENQKQTVEKPKSDE